MFIQLFERREVDCPRATGATISNFRSEEGFSRARFLGGRRITSSRRSHPIKDSVKRSSVGGEKVDLLEAFRAIVTFVRMTPFTIERADDLMKHPIVGGQVVLSKKSSITDLTDNSVGRVSRFWNWILLRWR